MVLSDMNTAKIINIQHFCTDDGPGIRTTVFFKGCNLRCVWCHNPESQSMENDLFFHERKCIGCMACRKACPRAAEGKRALFTDRCLRCGVCADVCNASAIELAGWTVSAEELLAELTADIDLYNMSDGGVTFSGGEPLLQDAFLAWILPQLHKKGIHTAVETAGGYSFDRIAPLLNDIDLVYCDLKTLDKKKHRRYTGVPNTQILDNIHKLSTAAKLLILRTPVIIGFNDEEIAQIGEFAATLPRPVSVELLPYHDMCRAKYQALNREFLTEGFLTPTEEQMEQYRRLVKTNGI